MRLRNKPWANQFILDHPEIMVGNPEELKGNWQAQFQKKQPIMVEIGCGKGRFITEMAKKHPEQNFIGIELQKSVIAMTLKKVVEQKIPNVLLIHSDGGLINSFFEKGEISKIFLNFSDPWPKKRHAKRRLTSSRFLVSYKEVLKPGSQVEFKTDNRKLFEYSLVSMNNFKMVFEMVNLSVHAAAAEEQTENVETEYEQKFKEKGPIYKLIAHF